MWFLRVCVLVSDCGLDLRPGKFVLTKCEREDISSHGCILNSSKLTFQPEFFVRFVDVLNFLVVKKARL